MPVIAAKIFNYALSRRIFGKIRCVTGLAFRVGLRIGLGRQNWGEDAGISR